MAASRIFSVPPTFTSFVVNGSFIERGTDGSACLVEDDVNSFYCLLYNVVASYVAFDEFDVCFEVAKVFALACSEVIEDPDGVISFEEFFDYVTSDKSGSACLPGEICEATI